MTVLLTNLQKGEGYRVYYGGGWIEEFPEEVKKPYSEAREYAQKLADTKDVPFWDETREGKESRLVPEIS